MGCCMKLLGLVVHETLGEGIETAFDSKRVAFQGCFPPTMIALLVTDFDEKPARKHAKVLNAFDFWHDWQGRREIQRVMRINSSDLDNLERGCTHEKVCAGPRAMSGADNAESVRICAIGTVACRAP